MKRNQTITQDDYVVAILSFLFSAFFLVGVVRPSVLTIANLQEQKKQLVLINENYESSIQRITTSFQDYQKFKEVFPIINSAVTTKPLLSKLTQDIIVEASRSGLIIDNTGIGETELKKLLGAQELKKVAFDLNSTGSVNQTLDYVNKLSEQKRLKLINTLKIEKDSRVASSSSKLNIKVIIDAFYL
jgi:hypothetical protein